VAERGGSAAAITAAAQPGSPSVVGEVALGETLPEAKPAGPGSADDRGGEVLPTRGVRLQVAATAVLGAEVIVGESVRK